MRVKEVRIKVKEKQQETEKELSMLNSYTRKPPGDTPGQTPNFRCEEERKKVAD